MPGGPTVVAIDGNCGQVLQDGIVDRATLEQLSQMDILFVCTGNTCRSPMAAALMKRKILEKFGETYRGHAVPIRTHSAGVSAFGGDPASHGARQAMRGFGLRLDEHQSAQLNASMVDQADLILVMGQRHRNVIVSQWPEAASKVHLLASDGGEISDPFGGPSEVYQRCAEQLERHTNAWIQRIDKSSLIEWT
jgi:protein-tyrosine phosphatase